MDGDLSNRENGITCKLPARAIQGTFVQEPLSRLTENIHGDVRHGDVRHSQRSELSVLSCCSSNMRTAVLTQAYMPCPKL